MRRTHSSCTAAVSTLLKGLSLISIPLGLLSLLLPNKHSQDLFFPSLSLSALFCHPSSFIFPVTVFHLIISIVIPSLLHVIFHSSLEFFTFLCLQCYLFLPFSHGVSSVISISTEDTLLPCSGKDDFLFTFMA